MFNLKIGFVDTPKKYNNNIKNKIINNEMTDISKFKN